MKNKANFEPFLYESCEELSKKFQELKSSRDLAQLLKIPYERLIYYLYKIPEESKYKIFYIPKKTGGYRTIQSPHNSLAIVQRKLSQVLYAIYCPRPSVHGFAVNRSIITNAKAHIRKKFVLNLDIKNFFESINFGRVRGLFIASPYKRSEELATILAQICCFRNSLPQGAPTSPIISNLICAKLDSELQRFAKEYGLFFTRYADDITFSANRDELPNSLVEAYEKGFSKVILGDELQTIIANNGFQINNSKVRLFYRTQRQEVTGLIVNKTVNVSRRYIRNLHAALHAWDKYGLEKAIEFYNLKYAKKKILISKGVPDFIYSLRGKIEFVGSVKGKDNSVYKKLLRTFNELIEKEGGIESLTE